MAGALLITNCASGTFIIIIFIFLSGTELYNCVFRTGAIAAITFKTVSAGKAAAGFKKRVGLWQPPCNFIKVCPFGNRKLFL